MIQFIEQYLQHYLDWNQDNWVELLLMAQFALNNTRNATTGMTPYIANLGQQPRMHWINLLVGKERSEAAIIQARDLGVLHYTIAKDIRWAEDRMKFYYDKKREDTPILREGDQVYLLR